MTSNKSRLTLGVDLGGTKIETALVDEGGYVVTSLRRDTNAERGVDHVIGQIIESIRECMEASGQHPIGLGIGVAGQVDRDTGAVTSAPNLWWRDVPLKAQLEEMLDLPVMVTNDVRAAAWGEWRHGAGQGVSDLVCIFVGTGVGGGVVTGGRVLAGSTNAAGELGHTTLVAGGRTCRCPNLGCLEAYVGGWAIAERAREAIREDAEAGRGLLARAEGRIADVSARIVSEGCEEGDPLARHLIDETGRYLGAGVVGIVNAFNPSVLVLGGSVAEGNPALVSAVEETVRTRALRVSSEQLRITISQLGGQAGVIGAAAYARATLTEHA